MENSKRKATVYIAFADFETSHSQQPKVAVWGFQLCKYNNQTKEVSKVLELDRGFKDSKEGYFYGTNVESFLKKLFSFRRKITVYFHNGAKFDAHFILKSLPLLGYQALPFKSNKNQIKQIGKKCSLRNELFDKKTHDFRKNYKTVVNESKQILELRVWGKRINGRKKKPNVLIFRDTKLLFNGFSIKQMGKVLKNTSKMEYDYKKIVKYEKREDIPKDLLIYLKRDVEILTKYTSLFIEKMGFYNIQMTAASTAYYNWNKSLIKNKEIEKYTKTKIGKQKDGKFIINGKESYKKGIQIGKILNSIMFPVKWLDKENLREAYKGGITYVNPKYECVKFKNITSFDINSSYPSVMLNELFPFDKPLINKKVNKNYPLKIYEIEVGNVSNDFGLPFIRKTIKINTFYPKNLKRGEDQNKIWLCTPEYELFLKYYKGKILSTKLRYQFKAIKGSVIFGPFINKWYQIKKTTKDPVEKQMSKIFLNSLYGKFGSRTEIKSFYYTKDWEDETVLNEAQFYLPLGIFITSYARCKLIRAVGNNIKDFIYCDTDSIYIKESQKQLFNIKVSDEIGDWKEEHKNVDFLARRRKTYIYKENKKNTAVCSGFHIDKRQMEFDDLINGFSNFQNKSQKKNINFGVRIAETEITLKPVWEDFKSIDSWLKNCNSKKDFENLLNKR